MNLAASHLASKKEFEELYKMEGFYRQKQGRKLLGKEKKSLLQAVIFYSGERHSLLLIRKFQTDWFIPLLGEAEAAVS